MHGRTLGSHKLVFKLQLTPSIKGEVYAFCVYECMQSLKQCYNFSIWQQFAFNHIGEAIVSERNFGVNLSGCM